MSDSPAPSPAYTATVTPFDLDHPSLRRAHLTEGQAATLTTLTVPIVIDGASGVLPCAQAEVALTKAATTALGRETCAVLHRWSRGGELWVLCGGTFVQVATIELTPARIAERAVA